jgi:heme A synthase
MFIGGLVGMFKRNQMIRRLAIGLIILFVLQLIAGLVNLILLAPVWMQIIHLLLADLVWINLILLSAANFAEGEVENTPVSNKSDAISVIS